MKKYFFTIIALLAVAAAWAQTEVVSGPITTDTHWKSDKIYILRGFVFVKNNAVLTIDAGTIIKGEDTSKGSLIITRGSKIMAVGTASRPIIFTSIKAKGERNSGDWGGVIILGKAPVNKVDPKIEGFPGSVGGDIIYGGTDASDNSGKLKYVRIEFAGIAYAPDNEINGLTLGGVGNGTEIDYVQVSYSGDDSYEFFGGTVNAKHLVAFKAVDDDFDTDFGFSGNVQFGVAMRDSTIADKSNSNGFESDNDATGTDDNPRTNAVFSNMTIVGPYVNDTNTKVNNYFQAGAHIRRNSQESILNSVIMGYPKGLIIQGGKVVKNAVKGNLVFENNVIAVAKAGLTVKDTAWDINTWFTDGGNQLKPSFAALGMTANLHNYLSPDWTLATSSPLQNGAAFTDAKVSGNFFDKVTYRGAFDATNWTTGWANYDPQNADYRTATAIKQITALNKVVVYPNPANQSAFINLDAKSAINVAVNIYDINGKQIKTIATQTLHTGSNNIMIDTNDMSNGIYYISLHSGDMNTTLLLSVIK